MKSNFDFQLFGYLYLMMCMTLILSCSTEGIEESQEPKLSNPVKIIDENSTDDFSKVYNENDCVDYCIVPDSGEYYIKRGYKSVNVGPNTKEMSYAAYNTEENFIVEVTYEITDGNSNANATITIDIEGSILVFEDVLSGTTVSHSIELEENFADCKQVQYYIRQNALGEPVEFAGSYNLVSLCKIPEVVIGEVVPDLGGIVFYILQEGDSGYDPQVTHGLVAATEDHLGIRVKSPWSINDNLVTNATGSGIGMGKFNTDAIISAHGEGEYAAKSCNELVLNGFDDWYLPSKDELLLMRQNLYLNNIGNIIPATYWSSTEMNEGGAVIVYMYEGGSANALKQLGFLVRAIRSF